MGWLLALFLALQPDIHHQYVQPVTGDTLATWSACVTDTLAVPGTTTITIDTDGHSWWLLSVDGASPCDEKTEAAMAALDEFTDYWRVRYSLGGPINMADLMAWTRIYFTVKNIMRVEVER